MLSSGKVLPRSKIKAKKKEQEVEEQQKNADRRELTTGNVIFCLVSCLVNIYEATRRIEGGGKIILCSGQHSFYRRFSLEVVDLPYIRFSW